VGIQSTSADVFGKVKELAAADKMGDITAIHTHMWRNARYGGWKREIPADCTPANVDWKMFQGESARRDFDANRVINWRFFWDYAGGNVFENMVHQVGFWYKVLGLKAPHAVTMSGANYLSPDMEVPDTMDVTMEQSRSSCSPGIPGSAIVTTTRKTTSYSAPRAPWFAVAIGRNTSPRARSTGPRPGRREPQRRGPRFHGSRRRRPGRWDGHPLCEFLRVHAYPQGAELPV